MPTTSACGSSAQTSRVLTWCPAVLVSDIHRVAGSLAVRLWLIVVALALVAGLASPGVAAGTSVEFTVANGYHYDSAAAATTPTNKLRVAAQPTRSTPRTLSGRVRLVSGAVLAAKGETKLYRAVSDDELDDVAKHGFRPGRNTMETKLFATSADDAARFGRANYSLDQKPFTLLEVRVPNPVANLLYRGSADSMPIRGLDPGNLGAFNRAARVRRLNSIPTGR